jgi:uncharacterized membrane protein YdjX (TVP38/TMEM64 family)
MSMIDALGYLGYVFYITILVMAVVCAPVMVLPIIPLASQAFGPFLTGVLSVIGWTIGSVIAFSLARYGARPLLLRVVSLDRIEATAAKISPTTQFWGIVLMRHLLPVDVLSYALGLIPSIRFSTYLSATFFGVIWFSFAFAYLGEAMITQNIHMFTLFGGLSLAVLLIGWYLLRHT